MNQEEHVSHIEIVEDEKIEEVSVEKTSTWKNLADLAGWKKDLKKIAIVLLVVAAIFGAYKLGAKIMEGPLGIRFHAPIERVKFQNASHENPNFSFQYPDKYVFDGDDQKKYGEDYLGGFHLKNDQRTGCDVRKNDVGINFSKSDQEISDAVSKDLAAHVKGFDGFSGKRIKLGKDDAYSSSFLLTDPLGNTLHIVQTMVTHDGQSYLLVCGSGQAQYEFFAKDFQDFLDSFKWVK